MIHESTPERIFKISELRVIASQLILINKRDVVNLACASRYLEEPVLSTLLGETVFVVYPSGGAA